MCRFSCGKPFLSLPCCQELTWRAASYTKASLLHSAVAAAAWSNLSAASLCPFLHFTFKSWRSRLIWSLKGQNQWEQVACPETDWFCCQPVWPHLPPPTHSSLLGFGPEATGLRLEVIFPTEQSLLTYKQSLADIGSKHNSRVSIFAWAGLRTHNIN